MWLAVISTDSPVRVLEGPRWNNMPCDTARGYGVSYYRPCPAREHAGQGKFLFWITKALCSPEIQEQLLKKPSWLSGKPNTICAISCPFFVCCISPPPVPVVQVCVLGLWCWGRKGRQILHTHTCAHTEQTRHPIFRNKQCKEIWKSQHSCQDV